MILPPIAGTMLPTNFLIYCAADENYFNLYGKALANSIAQNTTYLIHFHLYNPSTNTMRWCTDRGIDFTFEQFDLSSLNGAFERWKPIPTDAQSIKRRNDMTKDPNDLVRLQNEIIKTYYACTRFIRLAELLTQPTAVLMLDVDSLVRLDFPLPSDNYDIHIFEKNHKKHVPYTQHLASTIFYTGTPASLQLIKDHAELIKTEYLKDEIYWFLDQDTLDIAIQNYKKAVLDVSFVDFNFKDTSPIWCAKGPRKFHEIFKAELISYL